MITIRFLPPVSLPLLRIVWICVTPIINNWTQQKKIAEEREKTKMYNKMKVNNDDDNNDKYTDLMVN